MICILSIILGLQIIGKLLADCDEYSRQKSFHTIEKVKNIIVIDNDTASSPHSCQNSCESINSSKQNEFFVPSTGNAPEEFPLFVTTVSLALVKTTR